MMSKTQKQTQMKYVISIGVDQVDGLPLLAAAASGAENFSLWAESQDYKSKLHTDKLNADLCVNDIFKDIKYIVDQKNCEHLVIFFSGHGILQSPSQEIWLFPNAKNNPNESINLTSSIHYARYCGIPSITFISDACRILPTDIRLTISGSLIFPIEGGINQKTVIDTLYATSPGNPALELNQKASSEKFGLFTNSLLEILKGHFPSVIYPNKDINENLKTFYDINKLKENKAYKNLTSGFWQMKTTDFEEKLIIEVQNKAAEINISLSQKPEIRTETQKPKPSFAIFEDEDAKDLLIKANTKDEPKESSDADKDHTGINKIPAIIQDNDSIEKIFFNNDDKTNKRRHNFRHRMGPKRGHKKRKNAYQIVSRRKKTFKLEKLNRTGFIVYGDKIDSIVTKEGLLERKDLSQYQQIKVPKNSEANSALVILKNGHSVPVAIIKGYAATMVIKDNRLLSIAYYPVENANKKNSYINSSAQNSFNLNALLFAIRDTIDYNTFFDSHFTINGTFSYSKLNTFLINDRIKDISICLFGAYSFMQIGEFNKIKSLYKRTSFYKNKRLFDIAMLNGSIDKNTKENSILCFCPMLAIGWAYKNRFEKYLSPEINEASKYLVPNTWTTFDERGTKIIVNYLSKTH